MIDSRKTGESKKFNLYVLRRLFNRGSGRGTAGNITRKGFHPTISNLSFLALRDAVPVGKGRYGSPVVDLGLRLILAMAGYIQRKSVAELLALALKDKNETVLALREIADLVESYKPEQPTE